MDDDVWLPGWRRVDLGLHGGPYDDTRRPKALWHTTEGGSVAGARRAFAPYPPHLCYDPRSREREQYIPLNRHSYSLLGAESDDEYCLQVELVGYAGQANTWPDGWLRNIGQDVIRPLRDLAGVPDVLVRHGFLSEADAGRRGITLASASSPIRLTDRELRDFAGHLGHQHAPRPDEHWDPGGFRIARAVQLSHEEEDVDAAQNAALARVWEILDSGKGYYESNLARQLGYVVSRVDVVQAALVAAVADGDLDPAAVLARIETAVREGTERAVGTIVLPELRAVLAEALGGDNARQADAIVAELARRLAPAGTVAS